MADNETPSIIVNLILIILVLVLILGFIFLFNPNSKYNIFPDFKQVEYKVNWNEEYFLEHPEFITYKIEGKEANIYLRYNVNPVIDYDDIENVIGWEWSLNNKHYLSVNNVVYSDYSYLGLTEKNRNYLKMLINQSPEHGLRIIMERVRKNNEGNIKVFGLGFDVNLHIMIGPETDGFKASDKRLQDLDGVIDRLNQISRGYVKSRE